MKDKWRAAKPVVIALAIGLVIGPFVSNNIGWQVTSGMLEKAVRGAVVEQQALFCVERVKATGQDASTLDYSARRALAEKWAVMPGQKAADWEVISVCSSKLA
jgi:hypothetical protein